MRVAGVRCLAQGVTTFPSVAAFMKVLLLLLQLVKICFYVGLDDPILMLLQNSREGQEAIVKLLHQGVPDTIVRVACDLCS